MFELACPETASRVAQLEWPQEVARLFEVRANGEDLVNEIFHAYNAILTQVLLNKNIIGEWDTLLVDLAVSALVNELTDGLEVGIAVGDIWFNDL